MLQRVRAAEGARRRRRSPSWRRGSRSASAKSSGWRATRASSTARRSDLPIDTEPRADVVVLDTIGELAQLYQLATAVFVGGSLVDHGGHNILEPAVFGKPILFGPHMQNFKEIADTFVGQRRGGAGAVRARARARRCSALVDRSGPPRAARRGGARAGRGQSRRQGQDAGRDRRSAAAGGTAASSVHSGWFTRRA